MTTPLLHIDPSPTALAGTAGTPARAVESRDPATGEVWRRYEAPQSASVVHAVETARRAQASWAATPVGDRARIIERFRHVLVARRLEVATIISRENGKPVGEALATEVLVALDYAQFFAKLAPKRLAPQVAPSLTLSSILKKVRIEYRPHGVVGVISPWNYPFQLAAGVVLPALVAGNAVVLKPSEFTPTSGVILGELLRQAGLPEGVLQVVPGDGLAGAALVAAGVNRVSFTGSVATGQRVAAACAAMLIPCSLELGGSDPAIVLDDADLVRAARGIVWGRFSNAGQTCVAPKRVYVEAGVFDRFASAIAHEVEQLRMGPGSVPGTEVGPMIRDAQVTILRAQLHDAVARGATVVARAAVNGLRESSYFAPTVITNVTPEMRVMHEETFGPLLPLVKVADEEEAIRLANHSDFGLSASVWSGSAARGRRVAARIEAGTVAVNDVTIVGGMANVPHGGVKSSGLGRSHGEAGLLECVEPRVIVTDRLASARQLWWFRYGATHVADSDTVILAMHGATLLEKARAALRLLGLLRRGA